MPINSVCLLEFYVCHHRGAALRNLVSDVHLTTALAYVMLSALCMMTKLKRARRSWNFSLFLFKLSLSLSLTFELIYYALVFFLRFAHTLRGRRKQIEERARDECTTQVFVKFRPRSSHTHTHTRTTFMITQRWRRLTTIGSRVTRTEAQQQRRRRVFFFFFFYLNKKRKRENRNEGKKTRETIGTSADVD